MNIHSPYSQMCKLLVTLYGKRRIFSHHLNGQIILGSSYFFLLFISTFVTIYSRELNDGENQKATFLSLKSKSIPIKSNFFFTILPSKSMTAKYEKSF